MIFLDANVFLSFFIEPTSDNTREMKQIAVRIFRSVAAGQEEVTTSEVVVHGVCYILVSKNHYMQSPGPVAAYLTELLMLPGFTLKPGERTVYRHALERFAENPKLGFADAVIATHAERQRLPLATFDEYLAGMPFVTRWIPENSASL